MSVELTKTHSFRLAILPIAYLFIHNVMYMYLSMLFLHYYSGFAIILNLLYINLDLST